MTSESSPPIRENNSQGNDHVVEKRDDRAERERKLKPARHIDENADHAQAEGQGCPLCELQADLRPDVFLRHRGNATIGKGLLKFGEDRAEVPCGLRIERRSCIPARSNWITTSP